MCSDTIDELVDWVELEPNPVQILSDDGRPDRLPASKDKTFTASRTCSKTVVADGGLRFDKTTML